MIKKLLIIFIATACNTKVRNVVKTFDSSSDSDEIFNCSKCVSIVNCPKCDGEKSIDCSRCS